MHPAQNVVVWSVLAEEIKLRPSAKKRQETDAKWRILEKEKPTNNLNSPFKNIK